MNKVFRDLAIYLLVVLVIAYVFYAVNSSHLTPKASVEWSRLPAVVQEQLTVHAGGGEIRDVSRGVIRKKIYYRANAITSDGQEIVIKVEETGKLIGLKYTADEGADCKSETYQPSPSR